MGVEKLRHLKILRRSFRTVILVDTEFQITRVQDLRGKNGSRAGSPDVPGVLRRRQAARAPESSKAEVDIAWGSTGKDARYLSMLRRLLAKTEEGNRKLILYMRPKDGRHEVQAARGQQLFPSTRV